MTRLTYGMGQTRPEGLCDVFACAVCGRGFRSYHGLCNHLARAHNHSRSVLLVSRVDGRQWSEYWAMRNYHADLYGHPRPNTHVGVS